MTAAWWWGVDVSTWRVAIGARNDELRSEHVKVDVRRQLKAAERLAAVRHAAGVASRMLCDKGCWPVAVQVEQPAAYGHHVEPALFYAVGCAQAGVWSALSGLCAAVGIHTEALPVPPVDDVALAHAKLMAMGKGNAKKPEMATWARGLDGVHEPITQDECDALVVAECCRLECRDDDALLLRETPAA